MALLNIFKPKLEHSDPSIRLSAVKNLKSSEHDLLLKIIKNDSDSKVRTAALDLITELDVLDHLIESPDCRDDVKESAAKKSRQIHFEIVINNPDNSIKLQSLAKLNNEMILSEVAVKANDSEIRHKAVEMISDQLLLIEVIKHNCGKIPGLAAVEKINDLDLLEIAEREGNSKFIRSAAHHKLAGLKGPDPEQIKAEFNDKISELIKEAELLTTLPDPEKAHTDFLKLSGRWHSIEGEKGKDFVDLFQNASEVVEKRLATFQQYSKEEQQQQKELIQKMDELSAICLNITNLLDFPNNLNNDAFIKHTKRWEILAGEVKKVPEDIEEEYGNLKLTFQGRREAFKKDDSSLNKLMDSYNQIEELIASTKLKKIPSMLASLQKDIDQQKLRFLSTDNISEKVKIGYEKYSEAKTAAELAYTNLCQANLESRLGLLAEVESLFKAKDRIAAEKRVKEIQQMFAKVVDLPSDCEDLDERLELVVRKFKEIQNDHFLEKDWQHWTNKNIQENLIQQMEDLVKSNDLHQVFKKLKILQKERTESGPATQKEASKLWKRFKKLSDDNFNRCQQFFKELDEKAELNLQEKLVLIKQAEENQDSDQWNKVADLYKSLQEEWKKVGRAPKDKDEALYNQFRGACNIFFERRKAHYDDVDKQRQENLSQKEQLCINIEKLADNPEESFNKKIQEVQSDWKKIGPVPRKNDDEIWKRFRGACDKFYQWLDTLRPQNLIKKQEICYNADKLYESVDEKFSNLERVSREIIKLQQEWKTIGPAPKEENNKIWGRFRETCDNFFDKRKKHYAEIDQQRPINEERKKEIIKTVKELSKENKRKNVEAIIKLQDEWKAIGQASRDNEHRLNKQFSESCNDFFQERRQNFEELDRIRRENLKKKEELCLRLELISGTNNSSKSTGSPGKSKSSLTLAEQLQVAFESNFVMSSEGGNNSRRKKDEVSQIQNEWQQISGQVPREHEYTIKNRYKKALDACFATKKN